MSATEPAEYVPISLEGAQLATRLADAMTDFEPEPWPTSRVLELAIYRGLVELARQYRVTL